MKRNGTWLGPALRVAGLSAVVLGGVQAGRWALVAGAGGLILAFGVTKATIRRLLRRKPEDAPPLDFSHTVDLLRRAHGALAGWAVGLHKGEVQVIGGAEVSAELLRRGAALVRVASVDGRTHVNRELGGTYVAVGDFPYGTGLLLAQRDAAPAITDAAAQDLRRLMASMRLAEDPTVAQTALVPKHLALIASGSQTLDGVAKAGAELAQQLSQRPAAVAIQRDENAAIHILAVSSAADKRLLGITLKPDGPLARAVTQRVPVVTEGTDDIFGPGGPERRRQERDDRRAWRSDRGQRDSPRPFGNREEGALEHSGRRRGPPSGRTSARRPRCPERRSGASCLR